jgi:hypothetical protein
MGQQLTAGGGGADGAFTLLDKDGNQVVSAGVVQRGRSALTQAELRVGGKAKVGVLRLDDGEGDSTATIDGNNGHLTLGGRANGGGTRGSNGSITLNDRDGEGSVQINAGSDGAQIFLGAADKPASIQLTTGGNPGPTIDISGPKNALLFQRAGSNTDNIVEISGLGTATLGGFGRSGAVRLRNADGKRTVDLNGSDGALRAGGDGVNGVVSVRGADNMPLAELLALPDEGVLGLGQANRPGRISMYGPKGEAVRIDARSGDILLFNADVAELCDVDEDEDVEAGSVVVLGADGALRAAVDAYDTRVAGVVSGAGSFAPGMVLDQRETGRPRRPIALMGKVYCWADADEAPIRAGDLLTTSDRRGHAMRVTDLGRAVGSMIGKALQPLPSGQQLIPILVGLR